ncbi:MAG: hypothetical protein JNK48_13970 [Bryobacterales bacterium]|nr:hypothetical protein [Bryobacterales bacterium]
MIAPLAAAALLLPLGQLFAEPPPPPPRTATAIRIPFWLADGAAPQAPELKLSVNGKALKVTRLLGQTDDLLLLLVLDWAGDLTLVDPARTALLEELAKLPPNASVALLRAQDGLRVLLDPQEPREKLQEAIQSVAVAGRAGLLNSIEAAQQLGDRVASKSKVRVAVLFISDGTIGNYREDYTNPVVNSSDSGDMSRRFPEALINEKTRQIAARLNRGETPVFAVQLNYYTDRLNTAYQTGILDLAASSGGNAEFCRSLAEIPAAITKSVQSILSLHSVDAEWRPGKQKQLEVLLEAEGRKFQFRTRRQAPLPEVARRPRGGAPSQ